MDNLEKAVNQVFVLRRGLYAQIEIQPEITRTEIEYSTGRGGYSWDKEISEKEVTETIQERITEPDTKKREKAKNELEKIYAASEWYSARYLAAITLEKDIDQFLPIWLRELKDNLSAEKEEEYECDEETGQWTHDIRGGGISVDREYIPVTKTETRTRSVPDEEKRKSAKEDLRYLYKNAADEHKKNFGQLLGYSPFLMWLHSLFEKCK